jgi:adenylate kinase
MAPVAIFEPFSRFGLTGRTKLVHLGARDFLPEDLALRFRSLHLEHVSSAELIGRGISRLRGSAADPALAACRRWFFARKPDAGFVLADFPATLLQAQVFDEWLEARGEKLDAVLAGPGAPAPVVAHYRDLGLTAAAGSWPAPPGAGEGPTP